MIDRSKFTLIHFRSEDGESFLTTISVKDKMEDPWEILSPNKYNTDEIEHEFYDLIFQHDYDEEPGKGSIFLSPGKPDEGKYQTE